MKLNRAPLDATTDVSEPYPNPYPDGLGSPQTLRAWTVPVGLLKDGHNTIQIEMPEGEPLLLSIVDLAVR